MRTIPRSVFKSFTNELSFPIFEIVFEAHRLQVLPYSRATQYYVFGPEGLVLNPLTAEKQYIDVFSLDSGLEAFSRNPAHGSFSALTFQSTEFAKYVNQRFLSY